MGARLLFLLIFLLGQVFLVGTDAGAQDLSSLKPRVGIGAMAGLAYDPGSARDFVGVSAFLLFDYDRIWGHQAPENLKFKTELSIGSSLNTEDLILSSGIEALLYLDTLETQRFRPYVEAGIGLAYTGYRVDGQGLNLNFNPRAGIGTEIKIKGHPPLFCSLGLWHLSNGNLHSDNRGSNAVVLLIGRYLNPWNPL
ncbi:MAG: acyloxyacyl hydrolase [Desulfobacterium sp.]|nr:acyloxyacyl hydrolase [Desulfobacterium sp.]